MTKRNSLVPTLNPIGVEGGKGMGVNFELLVIYSYEFLKKKKK
jgi:hypothetical protein